MTNDAQQVQRAIARIEAYFDPHYGIDGATESRELAQDCKTLIATVQAAVPQPDPRDAEIARLREAFKSLVGDADAAGTWMDAISPLVERFDVAAKFDQKAVCNAKGSVAIAKLMIKMASRLDHAASPEEAAQIVEALTQRPGIIAMLEASAHRYLARSRSMTVPYRERDRLRHFAQAARLFVGEIKAGFDLRDVPAPEGERARYGDDVR
jgi:hypothetical protein